MKIIITGSSGFIGYHLANYFLKKKYNVVGIDSNNNYYSRLIKNKRLASLKKNKKFEFYKINLVNENKLERIENIIEKIFVLPSRKVGVDKNKKEYDWQGATG